MNITLVPVNMVDFMFPMCEYHLQRVVDVSHGDLCLEGMKKELLEGKSGLLVVTDGDDLVAAITATVSVMMTGLRVLYLPAIAGDRLDEWMDDMLVILKDLAKVYNCTEIRGSGREGWAKVLKQRGFKHCHTTLNWQIGEE